MKSYILGPQNPLQVTLGDLLTLTLLVLIIVKSSVNLSSQLSKFSNDLYKYKISGPLILMRLEMDKKLELQ